MPGRVKPTDCPHRPLSSCRPARAVDTRLTAMKSILQKLLLPAGLIAFATFTARAEPEIKGSPSELSAYLAALPGTVQIAGEGEVKTPADRAIVHLRIDSENKSLAEAIKLNHGVRAKLAAFLKEQGLGADRLQPAPFSSTAKQAIFSDKVKSHKVSTLVKITTHNEQEFQSVTKAVDQFNEVTYVRAEFEHSDKDVLKSRASAKACEDAERQKHVYEEKLGVKLVPKNIVDAKLAPELLLPRRYIAASGGTQPAYAGLPMSQSVRALAQKEDVEEETPFGELVFSSRVVVEYSVECR